MRQGIYELSLIGDDGVMFGDCEIDGNKYVRAEPGKEYEVGFSIHPNAEGNFPYACAICILTIDGILMCANTIHLQSGPFSKPWHTKFRGKQISSDKLQSFMFSEVANAATAVNSVNTSEIGHIRVVVFEAYCTDKPVKCTENYRTIPASTSIKEDKKFWQQPSLATSGGSMKPHARKYSEHVYDRLRPTPDAIVTLRYHAADVLDVLQDLHNKKNAPPAPVPPPVHVDFSAEPDAVPIVPVPAVVVDLRQDETAGVAVKVEKMQKKRKLGRSSMDQRTVEVVDLTL